MSGGRAITLLRRASGTPPGHPGLSLHTPYGSIRGLRSMRGDGTDGEMWTESGVKATGSGVAFKHLATHTESPTTTSAPPLERTHLPTCWSPSDPLTPHRPAILKSKSSHDLDTTRPSRRPEHTQAEGVRYQEKRLQVSRCRSLRKQQQRSSHDL